MLKTLFHAYKSRGKENLMQTIQKISLFLGILSLFNSGIEGVFHIDLFQRLFVNLPFVLYLIQLNGFVAGSFIILVLFEQKQ